MINKKLMIIAMIFVTLLAVSAISAADNMTNDCITIENENVDESISINQVDSIQNTVAPSYDTNLSVTESNDVLNEGSYLEKGPCGYIDSEDMAITYKDSVKYGVRLVGDYPNGESVRFIVYKGDSGTHVGDYYTVADSEGYAYLEKDLVPDKYWIQIVSDNYGSVYNRLTVKINGYSDAKIDITNTYYKYADGDIIFHWEGYLKGYFNIYKGSKLIHKKQIYPNAPGVFTDDDFSQYAYLTKKLSIGTYTVKIINSNGKVIKQASFKVNKIPTYVYCQNINAKYKTTKYITAKVYDKIDGNKASGTVKVTINGKTYKAKLKNGVAKIKIKVPSKIKTYKSKVTFLANSKYKGSATPFKLIVKKTLVNSKTITKKKTPAKKTTVKKKSTSKYKVITTKAKSKWITKKSGKFTVKTKIWDMTAGSRAPYKYIDTTLYKNGKQVINTKYYVKYKINGKWTGWKKYGTTSTAHHRYAVKDGAKVGQIKVKVNKNVNSFY
ncbi:hypothetical protein [Methanobrevibacter sp.]|uniref:hypothetical protein n=1 Tax=Methanobrevibacter sp. TaxID=66852 RepID=UPI0038642ECA